MRRLTVVLMFLAFTGVVVAAHYHAWLKDAEWEANDGRIVCTWVCSQYTQDEHSRTTSGYGACPMPY